MSIKNAMSIKTASEAAPSRSAVRRVIGSGVFGTAVEYYDFFIYGTAAALVFNKLFFPDVDPVIGTIAAFATFGVGFVVRPIGAAILGHVGDRIGRKRALVFSLLLMGIATVAIGFLPTFASVGILAPILLVLCRLVQGLALGGEWGGASVLAAEYSEQGRRGYLTSFIQLGTPLALIFSSSIFFVINFGSPEWVQEWGWRIPFWTSAILVGIGLWIRSQIDESPEFKRARAAGEMSGRAPLLEVFRYSWRQVLIAIGLRFMPDIGFYVAATFMVSYAVNTQHYQSDEIFACLIVAAIAEFCMIPVFGRLSDRFGRQKIYAFGTIFWIIWAFPLFALIGTGSIFLTGLGLVIALGLGHAATWGTGAAIFSELFPTRYRTTGVALGLNVSNVIGGGMAPLIASSLVLALGGGWTLVAVYLVVVGVVTLIATIAMGETSKRNLSDDYSTRNKKNIARKTRQVAPTPVN